MELVFAILARLRDETIGEVVNPAEEKRSEFHYGRVHGILYCLSLVDQELRSELEGQAIRQEQRESRF